MDAPTAGTCQPWFRRFASEEEPTEQAQILRKENNLATKRGKGSVKRIKDLPAKKLAGKHAKDVKGGDGTSNTIKYSGVGGGGGTGKV